jgi:hypothetical protein
LAAPIFGSMMFQSIDLYSGVDGSTPFYSLSASEHAIGTTYVGSEQLSESLVEAFLPVPT